VAGHPAAAAQVAGADAADVPARPAAPGAAEGRATSVTDEASAIEALGLQPRLVPGSAQNFKVTWPEDFALAEAVLANRIPGHRTP
jgi:hypothetical protein